MDYKGNQDQFLDKDHGQDKYLRHLSTADQEHVLAPGTLSIEKEGAELQKE